MPPKKFKNALEVFMLLDKSNCRECLLNSCMAFAGAVFTGSKKLSDCPHLNPAILAEYGERQAPSAASRENIEQATRLLKQKISTIDLESVAENLGGNYVNGKLTLRVLGKPYAVDANGTVHTDIHVIPWVSLPVYTYILRGANAPLTGNWVPLRELPGGQDWYRLFGQRCEKPLKKVADDYPDLFEDLVKLFNAKEVEQQFDSDISVALHPLPKVPMLICYWHPENELASDLHLFFDSSATEYLDLNSINSLGSGFVTMLEKLTRQHGLKSF